MWTCQNNLHTSKFWFWPSSEKIDSFNLNMPHTEWKHAKIMCFQGKFDFDLSPRKWTILTLICCILSVNVANNVHAGEIWFWPLPKKIYNLNCNLLHAECEHARIMCNQGKYDFDPFPRKSTISALICIILSVIMSK